MLEMRSGTKNVLRAGHMPFLLGLDARSADSLCDLYFSVLIAARSLKHLRRIHDEIIPPNCRLLRRELLVLEDFWHDLHPYGNTPADVPGISDGALRLIVEIQSSDADLTHYYLEKLKDRGESELVPRSLDDILDSTTIYSSVDRTGHGRKHFFTHIFGQKFSVSCNLSPDREQIVVRLVAKEAELTESLTYELLSKMPPYSMFNDGTYSCSTGYQVDFRYLLPMAEFSDCLDWQTLVNWHEDILVARDEFASRLESKLREIGVPLSHPVCSVKNEPAKAHKMA